MSTRKTSLLLGTTSAVALSVFAFGSMGSNTAYADCFGDNGSPNGDGWIGDNAPTVIDCDPAAVDGSDVSGDGDDGDPALGAGDTITIDGSNLGIISGNGGGDTIIFLDGLVSEIRGNEDGDTILMSGGQTKNDVEGNDGDDTILITGGQVGNGVGEDDVTGGFGDDSILIQDATVTVDVEGNGGNDIITINNSDIGDDVTGSSGNDFITIENGAEIADDVNSGGDDDTIVMTDGTVGGEMDASGGNDSISFTGGYVEEDVEGGSGDDNILISGTAEADDNVVGDSGNDVITVGGSARVGDGGSDDLEGGTGNDFITVEGDATIDRLVEGNEDNDTIIVRGNAEVGDDVEGDEGNDTITIAGSADILEDVEGNAGDDTINVEGDATIAGNVAGDVTDDADGEDVINISGGSIGGSVFGDSGTNIDFDDANDTINVTGGNISGSVFGEGGDDVITMNGGVVQNNIYGDGLGLEIGNDIINLAGGEVVGDVEGNKGDDLINLTGPIVIGGLIKGGLGDDTLAVFGGADPTEADGALGGPGQDTLTLDMVSGTVTGVDSWEQLIARNGSSATVQDATGIHDVLVDSSALTLNNSSVSNDVLGTDNDEAITIGPDTVVSGDVLALGGEDEITLAGGEIQGLTSGGEGDDDIDILAGMAEVVEGGLGEDNIFMESGTVFAITGDVFTPMGELDPGDDDEIILEGGVIELDVWGQGGNDLIVQDGADIARHIRGGIGDDDIDVLSGTVGAVVQGDAGEDVITIEGGSALAITGDSLDDGVLTALGDDDVINLDGGTIAKNMKGEVGDVWGQGGDDEITLNGTIVEGNIRGGLDDDDINLLDGVAGIVQGDAGEDDIFMSSGTVVAITGDTFLDMPDGMGDNDRIELVGGVIGLDVWGQGGNDLIIQAGADIADSIRAGNDDDVIVLADGVIGSAIAGDRSVFGNDGDDTAVVTGAFDFANLTGDLIGDNGAGDVGVDTLDFDVWTGEVDAEDLREWNFVNLVDSDVTFTGGVLDTDGPSDIEVFVDEFSTMFLADTLTIEGNLANEGLIDLVTVDGDPDNVLTVTGNYTAASDLVLDTFLNDGTPDITDQLIIGGDASGQTDITIVEVAGSPGGLTGFGPNDGILVVAASSSDDDAFSLTNPDLTAGIFEYFLANPEGQPAGQDNWYLQSDYLDQIYVYENLPGAMQTIGLALTGQLVERVGVRSAVPSTLPDADGNPVRGGAPVDTAIWGRAVGLSLESDGNIDSTTEGSFDQTIGFLQAGADVTVLDRPSGRLLIGALGHWGVSSLDANNSRGADVGTADFDFYGGGLTATWYSTQGWYFDNVVQYTAYDIDISTATRWASQSTDGYAISTSHEVGYRIPISETASLVPQGQLTYQYIDFDDFTDPDGVRVSLNDDDSLVGRLGVAFENNAAIGSSLATGYVEANVMYEFLGDNSVNTFTPEGGNIALNQQTREAWVEVGFGGTIAVAEGVSLYGEVDYALPFDGGVRGVQAVGGIRVNLNPPPAPPPPAPVIAPVAETAFIVFFDWDRADLTSEANLVLDDVVVVANQTGYASIRLDGYTDLSGSAAYNLGLSERRANSVANALIARGIAPDEIVIRAFGEENPLVPTPDGVREPQNRRVEIFLS